MFSTLDLNQDAVHSKDNVTTKLRNFSHILFHSTTIDTFMSTITSFEQSILLIKVLDIFRNSVSRLCLR